MPAIDASANLVNPAAQQPAAAAAPKDDGGFSFADFLDIINPLQHIPVIATLYRHLTGDKIGIPEKMAGDTLYGGAIGFVCSLGDAAFQELTGKDVGDTLLALVTGDDDSPPAAVASKPASVIPARAVTFPSQDVTDLINSLSFGAIDADAAQRAAAAYRWSAGRTVPSI